MPDNTQDAVGELGETTRKQLTSRRGFLAGSAAVGAVGLTGAGMGVVGADDHNDDSDGGSGDGGNMEDETTDIDILNYALTLEHLEATFYAKGLEDFSDDELMHADLGCEISDHQRAKIPEQVRVVGEHEAVHVDQITKVIKQLGGEPVEQAEYDFGYETPAQFLKVAKALENTGVAAYAGAAPSIENKEILTAAVSIHSVEARHAASFNALNGVSPYPDAFDEAKTMEEVKEIAGQFIVQ
ncbi:Tat (twin-arginine translocation) pathway signal sequence [Haladaptatus litoreus]|uniref:Tat (Twin-arginine translocation) pathway signal sequence n=1 Tax=Haladaptatus litoreus TaxID=553468 RepID=A0A1N6Y1G1_9EURY|nr:ferritin-like domain-containing protein [Haladaptatus litoreus]SIR08309.1 Tat (twin-arginine translocation) pathway signal sequence [Haladaptatus litoreus]